MPFLQFKGKTAVETYHYSVPHHALAFEPSASVLPEGQEPSLEDNLIVEGDNLLALKALLPTHAGRIKCIYIDPPYNTGNEGWVYNDNLTQPQFKEWIGQVVGKEGEDACRHDKWCCMMYPRLQLLKELLRDDGVIFISIDDNEVAHLRLLMDEIFGETNFVASVIWQKRTSPEARMILGAAHDYIVVYAKSSDKVRLNQRAFDSTTAHDFKNPDDDPKGSWASTDLTGQTGHATASQFYKITTPSGKEFEPPPGRCWALAETTFLQLASEGKIWFGKNGDSRPRLKRYLADMEETSVWTWWPNTEVGHNQEATKALNDVMGQADSFTSPKPVRLINRIIQIGTDPDSIILDSFAGSGTTGQAVLELNKDDGGNRKFVLVQQRYDSKDDEKKKLNICRTITAERVRRVIEGQGVAATGGGFTYARVSDAPLFGEYRDLGENPPAYEELAKYVFYTETSRQWDAAGMERGSGKIGEYAGTSYFLLYTPNGEEDAALDLKWLKDVALADPNAKLVVYCEKFWMHRDQLRRWEEDNKKSVRAMIVPFNLK